MSKSLEKALKNIRRGKLSSAQKLLKKILAEEPDNAEALYHLGGLLLTKGNLDESMVYLTRAVNHSEVKPCWYVEYAAALQSKGVTPGADKAYRLAEISGCNTVKFFSLYANFLTNILKDYNKAEIYWAKVIDQHPEFLQAYISLSAVYISLERYDEAIQVLEYCVGQGSQDVGVYTNLGKALSAQGRRDEAMACYDKAIKIDPTNTTAISSRIMELLYSSDDQEVLHQEVRKMAEPINKISVLNFKGEVDCQSDRKLRIGFISADFNHHAIAYYIIPIFANLNREKLALYLYNNNSIYDDATKLIKVHADSWCDCLHLSDEELDKQIRTDRIDILIDLSNHTAGNRLKLFARKPAPIQVSWMGVPVSTGLNCMDYQITLKSLVAQCKLEENTTEKLIPIESLRYFQQLAKMPDVVEPPCLENGYITFASYNGLRKINETIIGIWAQILLRVPNSKIIMVIGDDQNEDMQNYIYDVFAKQGVSRSRVILQGNLPMFDYLLSHNQVDIALDTYPYQGETTTYNSLLMGVPIISCAGKSIVSLLAMSILSRINRQDWVVPTLDEYADKAVMLAEDVKQLIEIRKTLRSEVENSPLMDYKNVAKDIEVALLSVWNEYCLSK